MIMFSVSKLDKEEIRKEFAKDYKSYYSVKLFDDLGFKRRNCKICGKNFWSIKERDTCEDPSHTPYSFFKEKPNYIGYKAFWDKFAGYFKKNGHAVIDRYPVVSRWRQDLYFTIASIQDFQRIENGAMNFEYGANPLIVPQICLRFGDIENVGVTGRHLTSFMMAGQHAFDWPSSGYWRDRTIELNFGFLTEVLGIKKEELVYIEDVWAMGDFSGFGPCLETFANGVELVNSVFTQFEYSRGEIRELNSMVVDVGWGFERLMWFYTGADNIYEAVFHDILKKLEPKLGIEMDNGLFMKFGELASELDVTEMKDYRRKEDEILKKIGITREIYEKKLKPMHALYAILDHMRTLLFAVADGSLPSNVGGGHNLRVILRWSLGFIEEYDLGVSLLEIAEMEARELEPMFPELLESLDTFRDILEVESARYLRSRENASKMVSAMVAKNSEIGKAELRTLYESHGVTPELLQTVAAKEGKRIEIPDGAYDGIIEGDFAAPEKEKKKADIIIDAKLPATGQLYYDFKTKSDSKILYSKGKYVVLDATPFYPEGGGQAEDHGTINGHQVVDVQKVGNVIVHIMTDDVGKHDDMKAGGNAKCIVDEDRRSRLMAHHTATHLISAAARNILGKHAWQEGARKDEDKAHIDIAHYDKLSDEDVQKIEDFANNALLKGIKVSISEMDRGEAEQKYSFSIYQGHGVPAKKMRIIIIKDGTGALIDAEACGGTHAAGMEQAIGMIKIINTSRIHDGVDRIEFVAGKSALDYFRKEHKELAGASAALNSDRFSVSERSAKLREDNISLIKKSEEKDAMLADMLASAMYEKSIKGNGNEISIEGMLETREVMRKAIGKILAEHNDITILAINTKGEVVCLSGANSKSSAIEFTKRKLGTNFRGGGSKSMAEGIIATK